jgi:hypothetical protein
VTTAALPAWYDNTRAALPGIEEFFDNGRGYGWVIYKRNQGCLSGFRKLTNTRGNRCTHFAVRIRVNSECDSRHSPANIIRPVAHDNNDLSDATLAQVIDTTLDDGFISERQQRLKRAHAAGAAGGKKNCCTGFPGFHMFIL